MRVTEEGWLRATAHAMQSPDTVRLFEKVPGSFDLFSLVSYAVYDRIKEEDLTGHLIIEVLVEVIAEVLPDRKPTKGELIRMMALVSFETSVYNAWKAENA